MDFLDRLGFDEAVLDGRMYGLAPTDSKKQHLRIQKPRRLACLSSTLLVRLFACCDASHAHRGT
eukprot:2788301-Alexandrium_andersonii.AAC.1